MSWKIDDAEFQAWANRVRARINNDELKHELENSSKRIGMQALKQFKANTPVDSGRLRGAWSTEGVSSAGRSWVITLINPTEYASYVDQGHRTRGGRHWVEGQFFVKRSASQVEAQLPQLITPGLWAFRSLLD